MFVSYAAAWRGFIRSRPTRANWPEAIARLQPSTWGVGLPEGRLVAVQMELVLARRAANDR